MSTVLGAQTVRAVAEFALKSGRRARFAMRGSSMLPLLREPMLLVVAPLERRARVGDLLVFTHGAAHVVHRVIGYADDAYVTSGDAQPHVTERVRARAVLGVVEAVFADGGPSARRVDTAGHRLCGMLYARTSGARGRLVAARVRLRGMQRRGRAAFARVRESVARLGDGP